jgi:hypothetical protein
MRREPRGTARWGVDWQQVVTLGLVQLRGFLVAMLEQGSDVGLGGIFDADVH